MSRKPPMVGEWALLPTDPMAVANARCLLALLRAVRRLPRAFEQHNHDDLGCELAPVLQTLAADVEAALRPKRPARKARDLDLLDDLASDDALDLADPGTQLQIGKGLARDLPQFRKLAQALERVLVQFLDGASSFYDNNVEMIARTLGLDRAETELLGLAASFEHGTVDRSLLEFVKGSSKLLRVLPAVLGPRSPQINFLAMGTSPLFASGLLCIDNDRIPSLSSLLLMNSLGRRLLSHPVRSCVELSRLALTPLEPRRSAVALAWPHLAAEQAMVSAVITGALQARRPGVNLMLYGPPGTGKSEFVRDLVRQIGATGYQVRVDDEQGDEALRHERLDNLMLCQKLASYEDRAVLVLDEAEDIFQDDMAGVVDRSFSGLGRGRRLRGESKGFVNRMLETNPHPVIWISNRIGHLDPAYLRRFALCLEFPRPPLGIRRQIASDCLQPVGCSAATVNQVAANPNMVPALLASAADCVLAARDSGLPADEIVRIQLEQRSKALGFPVMPRLPDLLLPYDLRHLNLGGTTSPQQLIDAMSRVQRASLLFSGPPGTGKTQFAAELARRLGRELVYRTAADINSMWFGESERNVASLFANCDPKSELLFLDEAETLLGGRETAGHRAVEAVTAEFLRRIEAFDGLFVCATNHSGVLDAAMMRRFVFRLEFRPLRVEQRVAMLRLVCLAATADDADDADAPGFLSADHRRRLQRLHLLTPGDFANVARRGDALGIQYGVEEWVTELEVEHAAKPEAGAGGMGFL